MSNSQLSIDMHEDLRFEYPRQTRLVDKAEVWDCRILISKFIKSKTIVRIKHR